MALLRSLTLALIEREEIKTTPARAKELRWYAERIVTLAKRGGVANRRHIVKLLGSTETKVPGENRVRNAIERVYSDLAVRFQTRPGGYTQILRLARRRPGDNAEMCIMRYIPAPETKAPGKKGAEKTAKAPEKKKVVAKKDEKKGHEKKAEAKKLKADAGPSDKPAKAKKDAPSDKPAKSKKPQDK